MDPYADEYSAPGGGAGAPPDARDAPPVRRSSRSRSPGGRRSPSFRSPYPRRSPPPRKPTHAPTAPPASNVLGVFGLSIRTQERDLDDEFSRFGRVEKVTIVYDQRSGRSRGFGFIKMSTTDEAAKCIESLNGIDLNGRRIRVDYSVTDRPHAPTPGEYMGHRRRNGDTYSGSGRGDYERPYERGGRDGRDFNRDDHYERRGGDDRDRDYGARGRGDHDRERDPYGRDNRDWRDRRSPPPRPSGRYSPDYKRRRSYSRSPPPPRGGSPHRARDYDANGGGAGGDDRRW